tara:strand:- start:133 stop:933 length:801 start_codon:yes stop_codon:yes gene_type:complete
MSFIGFFILLLIIYLANLQQVKNVKENKKKYDTILGSHMRNQRYHIDAQKLEDVFSKRDKKRDKEQNRLGTKLENDFRKIERTNSDISKELKGLNTSGHELETEIERNLKQIDEMNQLGTTYSQRTGSALETKFDDVLEKIKKEGSNIGNEFRDIVDKNTAQNKSIDRLNKQGKSFQVDIGNLQEELGEYSALEDRHMHLNTLVRNTFTGFAKIKDLNLNDEFKSLVGTLREQNKSIDSLKADLQSIHETIYNNNNNNNTNINKNR